MPNKCANPSCLKSFDVNIAQKTSQSFTAPTQQAYSEPPRRKSVSRHRPASADDEYVELPDLEELEAHVEVSKRPRGQKFEDVVFSGGKVGHGSRPIQKISKKKALEMYEKEAGHQRFGRESIDVTPEGNNTGE